MQRRTFLAATASATTVTLAGCASIGLGSSTQSCPDSPTPIEDLGEYRLEDSDDNPRPTIVGTVTDVDEQHGEAIIEGDTGRVVITSGPYPEEGKCVRVTGFVTGCIGDGCIEDAYYMGSTRTTDAQTTHSP